VSLIGLAWVALLPVTVDVGQSFGAALTGLAFDLQAGSWLQAGVWIDALVLEVPSDLVRRHGVLVVGPLVYSLVVLSAFGVAAGRSAALEVGPERRLSFLASAAYGFRHAVSAVGSVAFVSAGALALVGLTAVVGLVPIVGGLVGTLQHALVGLVGVLAVCLSLLALLSGLLISPAIACDGDGAIDAAQRAPAYVVQRPGTLLALVGLAALQGAVFAAFLLLIRLVGLRLASWAIGEPGVGASEEAVAAYADASSAWSALSLALVFAVMLSYAQVAATIVYMLLRGACDGQPLSVVWRAGEVAGVFTLDPARPQSDADAADS